MGLGEACARTARAARGEWARMRRLDLTDPTSLAQVRARIFSGAGLAAAVTEAIFLITPAGRSCDRALMSGVTAALAAFGALAWVRRDRVTDAEFLALVLCSPLVAAAIIWVQIGHGRVAITALGLLMCTLLIAVLSDSRAHVVSQTVIAELTLMAVARLAPPGVTGPFESVTSGFVVVAVTVVVRLLREAAVTALRTARVNEVTDPLTGLVNRRGLERLASVQWAQRARDRQRLALLVLDVDHFKRLNDTLGHAAGDETLRRLGDLLGRRMPPGGIAGRTGGEEFAVLCAVEPGQGRAIAENLRLAVQTELRPVTVSIGIYEVAPEEGDGVPALWTAIGEADHALYEAKRQGRNRTVELPRQRPATR